MKKLITTILVAFAALPFLSAQEAPDYGCTPKHEKALFSVQYYLTAPHLADERVKAGTNNIPVEQIKHVDKLSECAKLDSIVNSNPRFKKIDSQVISGTKFYYQTNDFYYIFWREVVKNVFLGPKTLFIVVKKQNKQVYECYI